MTEQQHARMEHEWKLCAGEEIKIEEIGGLLYAFCSELASLRLWKNYNLGAHNPKATQKFSASRESFYFALEPTTY